MPARSSCRTGPKPWSRVPATCGSPPRRRATRRRSKKMRFTDLFIRRPVLATVVSLLILLIGLRSYYDLPIRQYPRLENTVITVTTIYPGATADLMQGFITQPIAQVVASAEGIDYMTSSSTQGKSVISAYIKLNYDPNKALTDVMSKVN